MSDNIIAESIGIMIDIGQDAEESIVKALMIPAKKTIEVRVRYRGITKEYTIAEFFKLLGFDQETKQYHS